MFTQNKQAHRALAKEGKFIGSRAPFGYIKDPNDRHHLIVDEEAATVVKDIFKMFCNGIGYGKMTKYFVKERYLIHRRISIKIIPIITKAIISVRILTGM